MIHQVQGSLPRGQRVLSAAEFPTQSHEDVIAAWVKTGLERAVVSHETALAVYEVSPIRQRKLHLTVARAHRLYRGQAPCRYADPHVPRGGSGRARSCSVDWFSVRITSPARTIVDTAEAGTDPSVIVEAVDRALFALDDRRLPTAVAAAAAVGADGVLALSAAWHRYAGDPPGIQLDAARLEPTRLEWNSPPDGLLRFPAALV